MPSTKLAGRFLWLLLLLATATVCSDKSVGPAAPVVATVAVSGPTQLTGVGTSATFGVSALEADGTPIDLSDRDIVWSVQPASGVIGPLTVNGATAGALTTGAGTVTVMATIDGVSGSRTVQVTVPVQIASVTVTASATNPLVGSTVSFTATGLDAVGNVVSLADRAVYWSVAPVTGPLSGFMGTGYTASATASVDGSATITATVEGVAGSVSVTVTAPVPTVYTQLSAGVGYTCGITSQQDAYCWGSNVDGRLGDGTVFTHSRPTRVGGGLKFRSIYAGMSHTCGITTDGAAWCWGSGTDGQLGNGLRVSSALPVQVTGSGAPLTFTKLALGALHTCGIVNQPEASGSNTVCWGNNAHGELGIPLDRGNQPVRTYLTGGHAFASIDAGVSHTCAATSGGVVYCWGENMEGQLGDGTKVQKDTPTPVSTARKMYMVAAGAAYSCGLGDDAVVYCWGDNFYGQLGDGTTTDRLVPVAATPTAPSLRLEIGAAGNFTCSLYSSSSMRCWGANESGQQGVAPSLSRPTPSDVPGLPAIEWVIPGDRHACALTLSGEAWCWGENGQGQLGDGTMTSRSTPMKIGN